MGGDEGLDAEVGKEGQDELGDLFPLGGVGAGAELVEDDDGADLEALEEAADTEKLHAEVAFGGIGPGLFVEGGEEAGGAGDAAVGHGGVEAGAREELGDGECLQKAGLSARVGARDDDDGAGRRAHVAGDGANARGEQEGIEEALEDHGALPFADGHELGQRHGQALLLGAIAKG